MTKTKSLYQRGMKPYVRKINDQSTTSEEFEQTGNNIKFADSPLLEEYKLNTSLKSLKF